MPGGKIKLLGVIALLLSAGVFAGGPVPQEIRYHDFADGRTVLGVPNGFNVFSNLFLVLAGAGGLFFVLKLMKKAAARLLLVQYLLFYAGVFLAGFGSSWYHLDPSNATLVWDRLPMSIAFMSLFSSVISETIDRRAGVRLLIPLLTVGLFSVLYWAWTENAGRGDLRLYALVQFLPLILIPLILVLSKAPRAYAASLWLLLLLYVIAKLCELFDEAFFTLTALVSGHTLKHVAAAAAATVLLKMLSERRAEFFAGPADDGRVNRFR